MAANPVTESAPTTMFTFLLIVQTLLAAALVSAAPFALASATAHVAATAAFAAPLDERQAGLCASGTPVCCATDVLNLANLDCAPRMTFPSSIS